MNLIWSDIVFEIAGFNPLLRSEQIHHFCEHLCGENVLCVFICRIAFSTSSNVRIIDTEMIGAGLIGAEFVWYKVGKLG